MDGTNVNATTYTYGPTGSSTGPRAMAVSTIGYLCFGLGAWMVSMSAAGWYSGVFAVGLLFPLAVVLAIMGILGFVCGRGLDAIIFFTGATLSGSASAYLAAAATGRGLYPMTYLGWFAGLFALFFGYIWAGSAKSGATRWWFLLGTWVTLILGAIGAWIGGGGVSTGFLMAAGYCGLITAGIAWVVSASEVIRMGSQANPNLGAQGATTMKPMAAD
jgi:uncharacterized protein